MLLLVMLLLSLLLLCRINAPNHCQIIKELKQTWGQDAKRMPVHHRWVKPAIHVGPLRIHRVTRGEDTQGARATTCNNT